MQDDRRAHFGWRWQAFRLVSDSTAHPCVITRGSFPTLIFPTAACNRMQRNASSRKKFAHPLTYFPTPEAPKNTLIPAFSHTRHALRRSAVAVACGRRRTVFGNRRRVECLRWLDILVPMRWVAGLLIAAVLGCSGRGREGPVMAEKLVGPTTKVTAATKPVARSVERTVEIGRSVEGRAIEATVLGDGADVTLVLGAIHGNEGTSAVVARSLVECLRSRPEVLAGRTVAVVAVANPDGLARRLRTNKRLVDLNRNFPAANWARTRKGMYFGGTEAGSEPETVALMGLYEELRPARVVSIHSMDKPCNNYDGPAKGIAEMMSALIGYEARDNIGYPTPGSLGSWAGIDRQIPMITLELPRKMGGEEAWEQNRSALLAVISMRV